MPSYDTYFEFKNDDITTPLSAENLNMIQDEIKEDIRNVVTSTSDSNVTTIKFNDGTAIITGATSTYEFPVGGKNIDITLNTPITNVSNASVLITIKNGSASWTWLRYRGFLLNSTTLSLACWNEGTNVISSISFNYQIVGRWK